MMTINVNYFLYVSGIIQGTLGLLLCLTLQKIIDLLFLLCI